MLRMVLETQRIPDAQSGNVIAEIVGRERPDEIVLLGAHLDSWDLGTGAVDDGAGVGIILGAAKLRVWMIICLRWRLVLTLAWSTAGLLR